MRQEVAAIWFHRQNTAEVSFEHTYVQPQGQETAYGKLTSPKGDVSYNFHISLTEGATKGRMGD
jgi:hypothetical protein